MAATAATTVKSILGTVTDTATTISDTVKTFGLGIGMVNRFVESASTDQKDRQLVHRKVYRQSLIQDTAMEMAKSGAEVIAFCNESPEQKTMYLSNEEELKALFAD